MKFGPVVQEEMSFKEKVYARRTDGRRTKTDINNNKNTLYKRMYLMDLSVEMFQATERCISCEKYITRILTLQWIQWSSIRALCNFN